MTSPRTLVLTIAATAAAFALALGSVVFSAALEPTASESRATTPARTALAAAPLSHPGWSE